MLFKILPKFNITQEEAIKGGLTAPMPGKVVEIKIKKGSNIKKGDTLVILEAMKMEHKVLAPDNGKIKEVLIKENDQVYFLSAEKNIDSILKEMRDQTVDSSRIMIVGGGMIGSSLASSLENKYKVKVLETSLERCEMLSKDLNKAIEYIKSLTIKKNKLKNNKVLYGGSVNPKNIKNLSKIGSIDGFLIGGASQKSKNFIDIIKKTIN